MAVIRFSLLCERWHTSSRAVTVLMLLFLVFCNVPGQYVKQMLYKVGHPFYDHPQFEHGWPLTYLIRPVQFLPYPAPSIPKPRTVRDCFELWQDVEKFRPEMLIANSCLVLLASLATGLVFEAWRRARSRLWQFHLKDLLAATLIFSLIGAWYFYAQKRYAAQERIYRSSLGDVSPLGYQEGGITWLRCWLGDQAFQFLDEPFGATVYEGKGWAHLGELPSVRHVEARILCTTQELGHLADLPRLEALSLGEPVDAQPDSVVAELPLLRLRGLYLWQRARRYRGINRLTSLESLRIGEGCIDDTVLQEISDLPSIRQLALNGLRESDDISFLPLLPKLSGLDLYHSSLSGAALQNISQCPRLTELSLYMCHVDASGIRHLSNLTNLETLDLQYTNVTSADLAELATLKRLRKFELTGTKVGGDFDFMSALESLETLALYSTKVNGEDLEPLAGLKQLSSLDLGHTSIGANGATYLRQMKQLKWLRVSNMSKSEQEALRVALPGCKVDFH